MEAKTWRRMLALLRMPLLVLLLAAMLGLAFAAYLRPEFMLDLGGRIYLCSVKTSDYSARILRTADGRPVIPAPVGIQSCYGVLPSITPRPSGFPLSWE